MNMDVSLTIDFVSTSNDFKDFLKLPSEIYSQDPQWVPPLGAFEKSEYTSKGNPVLGRSEHRLLIARRSGETVARMIIYIDPRYNEFHHCKTGLYGSFEAKDDREAVKALFEKAERWFAEKEMDQILGPINPVSESWGFVLEGTADPVFLSPHNPLYYNDLLAAAGYAKEKDLLVYEADGRNDYLLPERYTLFSRTLLARKSELSVRRIKPYKLKDEARNILRILNDSVAGNWGFVPVEEKEMMSVFRQLRPIMDRDAIWLVEDEGDPVGVALGFPDINIALRKMRGRITPLRR